MLGKASSPFTKKEDHALWHYLDYHNGPIFCSQAYKYRNKCVYIYLYYDYYKLL